ncbi:MAG: class I SAM-dependent methyltransferase [Gammaproteobacteria bacterium]|nr:class I SAM-dependent methyltransferase [Gammaproteobacteria bacterium]
MSTQQLSQSIKKNHAYQQHIYKEYAHGVYYCTTYTAENRSPKLISIHGKVYTRFLDFIYMPCETHELNRVQCIAVNDIRNIYFETHKDMVINNLVKQRVSTIINQLCTTKKMTLLEYGCGYQTIHELLDGNINYVGTDINEKVIAHNKTIDSKSRFITIDKDNIPIKDQGLDLIVSVFVFHFNVTDQQLSKLFSLLSEKGIMMFNLYLLPKDQRQLLFSRIKTIGFTYHRETDPDKLCQNHEYCFLAKHTDALLFKKAIALFKTNTSPKMTVNKSNDLCICQ